MVFMKNIKFMEVIEIGKRKEKKRTRGEEKRDLKERKRKEIEKEEQKRKERSCRREI